MICLENKTNATINIQIMIDLQLLSLFWAKTTISGRPEYHEKAAVVNTLNHSTFRIKEENWKFIDYNNYEKVKTLLNFKYRITITIFIRFDKFSMWFVFKHILIIFYSSHFRSLFTYGFIMAETPRPLILSVPIFLCPFYACRTSQHERTTCSLI